MPTSDGLPQRRVLFLTPQQPYPPEQGTSIRNYNLLAQVARSHRVALLSFTQQPHADSDLARLQALCERVVTVPAPTRTPLDRLRTLALSREPDMARRLWSDEFWQALVRLVEEWQPDVVEVEGIELGRYALLLRERGGKCPAILFDDHNAEYVLQRRAALADLHLPQAWPKALYSLLQWRRLRRFERRLCLTADAVVAVSPQDAAALAALAPGIDPLVAPNGVDTARYRPGLADTLPLTHPAVVFTGKMDYRPNVDAVLWFAEHVWPQVLAASPQARLYIVGKSPRPPVAALTAQPSIVVTGYVAEILPYFGGADVYVAPLRVGGGTRLKVLEAMAAGLPIVSTSQGAEGIDATHNVDMLLADKPTAFAAAVAALLADRTRAAALGAAARRFVERHYDWASIAPPLVALLARL
jgi:sugar transferase (PEP-CTERM/EpsH1 system associated)